MRWSTSQGPRGLRAAYECPQCAFVIDGADEPARQTGAGCSSCPSLFSQWVVSAAGGRVLAEWLCRECAVPSPGGPRRPPADRPWPRQSPPERFIRGEGNSLSIVFLLWAAAGLLTEDAARAWEAHPAAGGWWHLAVTTLRQRPARRARVIADAWDAQALGMTSKRAANAAAATRLREAALRDASAALGIRRLLGIVAEAGGYVGPVAQEALLLGFGGPEFATSTTRLIQRTLRGSWASAVVGTSTERDAEGGADAAAPLPGAHPRGTSNREPSAPTQRRGGPRLLASRGQSPVSAMVTSASTSGGWLGRNVLRTADGASAPPATAWADLGAIDLVDELHYQVRIVREAARWSPGSLGPACATGLREFQQSQSAASWKLSELIPSMLLRPTTGAGSAGRRASEEEHTRSLQGHWLELLQKRAARRSSV